MSDRGTGGPENIPKRELHPLPRGLVELYGLVAVLVMLIPEWMASGTLQGLRGCRRGSDLPVTAGAWKRIPELRLALMSLAELRLLARGFGIRGYASMRRDSLHRLLLRLMTRMSRVPERIERRIAASRNPRRRR